MSDDDLTQWWSAYDDPAGSAPPADSWDAALDAALDPASEVDFALYEPAPAEVSGVTVDDDALDGFDPAGLDPAGTDTDTVEWNDPATADDLSVALDDDPAGDDWPDPLDTDTLGSDPLDTDSLDNDPLDTDSLGDF